MEKSDVSCPLCGEIFDSEERDPRTLPCGHTFCHMCLDQIFTHRVIRCPEDYSALTVRNARDLPQNFILLRLAKKFISGQPPATCPEHRRPLEYICLEHKTRICVECGLSGSHKQHEIKPVEDLKNEFDLRMRVLCDLVEMLKDGRDGVLQELSKVNEQELYRNYIETRGKWEEQVRRAFEDIRASLMRAEQEVMIALQSHCEHIEGLFHQIDSAPNALDQHLHKLSSCINSLVDQIETCANPFELFDTIDQETDRFLPLSEDILCSLSDLKNTPSAIKNYIQSVVVEVTPLQIKSACEVKLLESEETMYTSEDEVCANKSEVLSAAPGPFDEVQFNSLLQDISSEKVTEVDFSLAGGNRHTAIGEKAIALAPFLIYNDCLLSLRFSGNQLSVSSVRAIFTALEGNPVLQRLEISHNELDQSAVRAVLQTLESNKTLQEVNLQYCPMSHEDRQALKQMDRVRL